MSVHRKASTLCFNRWKFACLFNIQVFKTKCHGQVVNTYASYSGGFWIQILAQRETILWFLSFFSLLPSALFAFSETYLKYYSCVLCDLQILDALDIDPHCKKMHLAHKLENVGCTLDGEETSTCWRRESPDLLLANLYWDKKRRDCDMLHAHATVNCDPGDCKWCDVLLCYVLCWDQVMEQLNKDVGGALVNERIRLWQGGWDVCQAHDVLLSAFSPRNTGSMETIRTVKSARCLF